MWRCLLTCRKCKTRWAKTHEADDHCDEYRLINVQRHFSLIEKSPALAPLFFYFSFCILKELQQIGAA